MFLICFTDNQKQKQNELYFYYSASQKNVILIPFVNEKFKISASSDYQVFW